MSRKSSAPRTLSLPEELEKLEQSITLTLQEIDSNFSKAHRIVTGSILPIVEQYGKHSNAVWDGSKVLRIERHTLLPIHMSLLTPPPVLEAVLRSLRQRLPERLRGRRARRWQCYATRHRDGCYVTDSNRPRRSHYHRCWRTS